MAALRTVEARMAPTLVAARLHWVACTLEESPNRGLDTDIISTIADIILRGREVGA